MRPPLLLIALASLSLAACDRGGSAGQPARESPTALSLPEPPAPMAAPPPASETQSAPEAQARTISRAPEVAIAEADGRAPRQIAEDRLLPLNRIMQIALRRVPGEIIEVDLDDDDDEPEYELEILTADGRSIEMKIDARRGTILEVEED